MKINLFSLLIVAILFVGCAASKNAKEDAEMLDAMNTWVGVHISQLIKVIGPPTETASDGNGGKIYIWRPNMAGLPAPQRPVYNPNVPFHLNMSNTAIYSENLRLNRKLSTLQKMFFVRPNGTIYYTNINY